jgi:LacI family transcriptional regulator
LARNVRMVEVAREAGVSLMTVSRVINHKQDVNPKTRQRVLEVIQRLGYRPSGIARGLATRRTATLGLVVPDISNPFFSSVARGVEHVAYAGGYNVLLCNSEEDPEREWEVLLSLEDKHVDGVVLCSSRLEHARLKSVLSRHPAVVLVNRRLEAGVDHVLLDDEAGGGLVARHLLGCGHRRIGLLAGPAASYSARQREAGFRAALAMAGLFLEPAWIHACAPTVAGGQQGAAQLLQARPDLTALFCYNDLVAVGALQAAAGLERRVPQDLAVVGFDDILLAGLVTPALTTCRVPLYELGSQAARSLLARIQGCPGDCREIVLQPELIVRQSAPY